MKDDKTAIETIIRSYHEGRQKGMRVTQLAYLRRLLIVACLATLLMLPVVPSIITRSNAQAAADVVALRTQLPMSIDGIPNDAVWGQIPPTLLTLTSTTPSGGKVPQMWVRAAHDANNLYVLMQWPDSKEARSSSPAIRLATSTPGNLIGQYKANATYFFEDSAAIAWWMGPNKPTVLPAVNNEMGGSPTRRTSLFGWGASDKAELWDWKSAILDLGNPYWPYAGLDAGVTTWHWGDNAGKPYEMPYSAAVQGLWNSTGYWVFGDGLLHSKGCQQPNTKPFEVRARGVWTSGLWTLELSRPLVSSPENRAYTMPFEEGKTYWATFGAFDGNKGEWEEVSSRSGWASVEVSKEFVPLEKQNQQAASVAADAAKGADAAAKTAAEASKVAADAAKSAADAVKGAGDASKVAADASRSAADAAKGADAAVKSAGDASKGADTAAKNSADAQKVSQDALSAAQQAVGAAENSRKIAEATTNLAYGTIGIAIVAIVVSVVMGLRKRKP
jgi:hypothetical protein